MSREQTSIGSSKYYGERTTDKSLGHSVGMSTGVEYVDIEFDYDDLPGADATDAGVFELPSGAVLLEGFVDVTTAVTGATAFQVGLIESDGTAIDADGLIASATLTAGTQVMDGALIGTKTSERAQFVASFTGVATAGSFRVRLKYTI